MALPYPEGEVYFKRSALQLPQGDYKYSADEPLAFYSHVLIEQVWNAWASSESTIPSSKNVPTHLRADHKIGSASYYGTEFGVWNQTCVMFSDDLPNLPNYSGASEYEGLEYTDMFHRSLDVLRSVKLENNQNYGEIRDRSDGGPLKTILRPVPMGSEKYMYLDLNTPIRAVYFPLAQKSSALNQDLCTYVVVDFRLRKGVKIRHQNTESFVPLNFSYDLGLGRTDQLKTLCFDVPGIIAYLCLPRQMRNVEMGLYKTATLGDELITLWDSNKLPMANMAKNVVWRHFIRSIDLAEVISDNFGVDVVWQPYEYSDFALELLATVTNLGLALIPTAGPLLAVAFHIGLQAITDPKAFELENIPKLDAEVMAAVIGTLMGAKSGGGAVAKAGSKSASIVRNLPKGYRGSKVTVVSST